MRHVLVIVFLISFTSYAGVETLSKKLTLPIASQEQQDVIESNNSSLDAEMNILVRRLKSRCDGDLDLLSVDKKVDSTDMPARRVTWNIEVKSFCKEPQLQ